MNLYKKESTPIRYVECYVVCILKKSGRMEKYF